MKQIREASKLTSHLLVAADMNLDLSVDKDTTARDDIKHLLPIYQDFLNDDHFAVMNTEKTRFQINQEPSLIDHLVSNTPQNFDNIETKKALISDHRMVMCYYHVDEIVESPRMIFKTNWSGLNSENITASMLECESLMSILSMTDPDKIWSLHLPKSSSSEKITSLT